MAEGTDRNPRVLAIDAGGTMTDTFIVDERGEFVVGKAQTTPEDEAVGFMRSAEDALAQWGSSPREAFPMIASGIFLECETLAAMLDEKLSRQEVKDIESAYKDPDCFDKWISVLQERVPYDDPIVLPMGEGLHAVRGPDGLIVRCDGGHDFCAPDRNWKMEALVYVRDDAETLAGIYPGLAAPDPEWMELREYYCPSCARQLETEALPPGYPVVHEFLPDIEGLYRGWLRRELP